MHSEQGTEADGEDGTPAGTKLEAVQGSAITQQVQALERAAAA